jgi:hypothetical protein
VAGIGYAGSAVTPRSGRMAEIDSAMARFAEKVSALCYNPETAWIGTLIG